MKHPLALLTALLLAPPAGLQANAAHAPAALKAADRLSPLPAGAVHIEGYLGRKPDACIASGIMSKDHELYLKPFAQRNDDPDKWRGEFWAKWFTSAALANRY